MYPGGVASRLPEPDPGFRWSDPSQSQAAKICTGTTNLYSCVHSQQNSPQAVLVVEPVLGLTVLARKLMQVGQAVFPTVSLYVLMAHAVHMVESVAVGSNPTLHTEIII